jgi:hypothetical protein
MNEPTDPSPNYETPFGTVSPAMVGILPYAFAGFVVTTFLTYGILLGRLGLPSDLGTALLAGGIMAIVVAASIDSWRGGWCRE